MKIVFCLSLFALSSVQVKFDVWNVVLHFVFILSVNEDSILFKIITRATVVYLRYLCLGFGSISVLFFSCHDIAIIAQYFPFVGYVITRIGTYEVRRLKRSTSLSAATCVENDPIPPPSPFLSLSFLVLYTPF